MTKRLGISCLEALKKSGPPVIIVVASYESEAIFNACQDHGIDVHAFCDSEKRKSQETFCDLEVVHTPSLPDRFSEARFVIASQQVQDVVDQLTGLGFGEFYSALELLEGYDVKRYEHRIAASYMETRISVYKTTHAAYFDDEKTYMRSLDVMITTKCSLKCESCSNLMQYYVDPSNVAVEQTLDAIKTLDECVDEISEFRVIGGEPLMNREWANIVNGIVEGKAGRKVFIYTNGTISPRDDQLESFVGKDINFIVTDYGRLSRNVHKLVDKLSKYDINFVAKAAENWLDCSSIRHHNRSRSELKEVFKQCCVKYVYTLLDGRLFRCPFIANATNLKAIPDNPNDYVDLTGVQEGMKQKIRKLVRARHFFPGCDFCDGRPYDPSSKQGYDGAGMIAPGVQTANPLPYKMYQ
jgi:organic radical activating enzyme